MAQEQVPDTRPGHYYVSALPGVGEVKDKYWLLAGPWPTHAEALAQVRPVWDYALRVDTVGATWKSFGTCRREIIDGVEAAPSKLGSDARKWGEFADLTDAEIAVLAIHRRWPVKAAEIGPLYMAEPALRSSVERGADGARAFVEIDHPFVVGLRSRDYMTNAGRLTDKGRRALAEWRP
jgi:hypothetical protein